MSSAAPLLRQPVECAIEIDGAEITEVYPYLREVSVEMRRSAPTVGKLAFDSVRKEDGAWSVQDSIRFEPWRRIKIEAVFGAHREEVVRGYIKTVDCDYPEDMSAARVTVYIQDESLVLDRQHMRESLSEEEAPASDAAIFSKIAAVGQFATDCQGGLTHSSLNLDATYASFLRERAAEIGFETYVRAGTLYFHAPRLDVQRVAPIRIYAGHATNCLKFNVHHDGHKPDEVLVQRAPESGKDVVTERYAPKLMPLGKAPTTSSTKGLDPFSWIMKSPGGGTPEDMALRAQARADESCWQIQAEGELDGALYGHVLLPYQLVPVDGAGPTHNGTYYVDEVAHTFSTEGYRLVFKLLRNATGDDTPAALYDPVSGAM